MGARRLTRLITIALTVIFAAVLVVGLGSGFAQKHGGGGGTHGSGAEHSGGCGDSGGGCSGGDHAEGGESGHSGKKGGMRGGAFMGRGARSQSLRDIFNTLESDESSTRAH